MLLLTWLACADDPDPTTPDGDSASEPAHSAATDPTDTEPSGACGPPIDFDLTLVGTVVGPYGAPAPGAAVWVEDRGWEPGRILGSGTADPYGAFTLALTDVTSVDRCWATLLDYVLVGERTVPGGAEAGELDLNSALYGAIEDGSLVADLGAFPLTLSEVP